MSKVKELILDGFSFMEAVEIANVEVKSNNCYVCKNKQDAIYIFDFLSSILTKNTKIEMTMNQDHGIARYVIQKERL